MHLIERTVQSLLFHMSVLNMPLHKLLLRAGVSTAFAGIAWAFPSRSRRGKTEPVCFVFMRPLREVLGKLLPFIVNRFASLLSGGRNGWRGWRSFRRVVCRTTVRHTQIASEGLLLASDGLHRGEYETYARISTVDIHCEVGGPTWGHG